jgi:hypothetical protein
MGIFGVNYWVSKAPNDLNLTIDDRINKPLRILCIADDPYCKPVTPKIQNENSYKLEKYGLVEFESSIDTESFFKLSPRSRFDFAIKDIGMKI